MQYDYYCKNNLSKEKTTNSQLNETHNKINKQNLPNAIKLKKIKNSQKILTKIVNSILYLIHIENIPYSQPSYVQHKY